MASYGAPFLKPRRPVGLSAADAARSAESARLRESALAAASVAAASAGASASGTTSAAGPPAERRRLPPETQQRREARLAAAAGHGLQPSSGDDADHEERDGGNDGMEWDNGFDDGAGLGGEAPFESEAVTTANPSRPPPGPPEPAYVTQHNSFVNETSKACAALTSSIPSDVALRQNVYRHAFGLRATSIDDAWMKHRCFSVECSQARLQGADAERLAALKARCVLVKDSPTTNVIVQVNSFFHPELQKLSLFCCKVCGEEYRASPVDFGCAQGSLEFAANGTTQLFTNENLDAVFPLWRRGSSFKGT